MIEKGAQLTRLKKKIKAALHAVEKTGLSNIFLSFSSYPATPWIPPLKVLLRRLLGHFRVVGGFSSISFKRISAFHDHYSSSAF